MEHPVVFRVRAGVGAGDLAGVVVTGVDKDLATLGHVVRFAWDNGLSWETKDKADASLLRVEAELARLRQLCVAIDTGTFDTQRERAEAAEARCARLQQALDPETLARMFHATYERLAPVFGYRTRRESAVPWEEVPEANRRLMVAVAEVIAREALAGPDAPADSPEMRPEDDLLDDFMAEEPT